MLFALVFATSPTPAWAASPSLSGVDATTVSFLGTPVSVAPNATLSAGDDIDGAIVSIGTGFNSGGTDTLGVSGALPGGITSSYDAAKGILTLSGTTTPANYQAALRMVTFTTTATLPGTSRQIAVSLGKALPNPDNGHYYQFISAAAISWTAARDAASALTYFGRTGYLATITSSAENTFVFSKSGLQGWIGASDEAVEGEWKWVTGPEAGTQFWQGAAAGTPVGGQYNNWSAGEPNDYGSGEDYTHFLLSGKWNDYPLSLGSIAGYYVEYGGLDGDAPITNSGVVTVNLASPTPTPTPTATSPAPAPAPWATPVGGQAVGGAGGAFYCAPWYALINPGNVPDGTTLHCGAYDPNFSPPAPAGLTFLRVPENVILYDAHGNRLTFFNPPLQMCYDYSDAELARAGGDPANFVVVTAEVGGSGWTELPTTVDTAARRACGSTTHLTLFELAARTPSSLPATGNALPPAIGWGAGLLTLAGAAGWAVRRGRA